MEDFPHTIIELPPNRTLYKKGEFYASFYFLVSGELTVTINQNQIRIADPIVLGDYEIIEGIDYRLSLIKSVTRCVIKVIDVRHYSKLPSYHREFEKAFEKFSFRSKTMNYWLKKLFQVRHSQRNDTVGTSDSVGVVLEGLFKIDRNIPIVRMKAKNLQLLKRFEICLMSSGQIFSGVLICESTKGLVGVCKSFYVEQLAKCFEEFKKITELASFKGEVHNSMEKQIAKNCRKKSKLFSNMVPIPLQTEIRSEQEQEGSKTEVRAKESSPETRADYVFRLSNNISQFLHKQWRKGLSLSIKRRETSPVANKLTSRKKVKKMKNAVDLNHPIVVTFDKVKLVRRSQSKTKLQSRYKEVLPSIRSIRMKTEGSDKLTQRNKKYLYFE